MKITIESNFSKIAQSSTLTALKIGVHDRLARLWRDATKEMIRAIAEAITVDTGMSRASTLALAARVRQRSAIAGTIAGKAKFAFVHLDGTYDPSRRKSKTLGAELGKDGYSFSIGSPTEPIFHVEFRITVFQHLANEGTQFSSSKNWQSLQKGFDAFVTFFNANKFNKPYVVPADISRWFTTGRF